MQKKKTYTKREALIRIQRYCAIQERAHTEVINKLYLYGLGKDEIDELLIELISSNFLNEERFAEAFVSGKFNIKKWGKQKITLHLKQKKVSEINIKKAIQKIDNNQYVKTIFNLLEKKNIQLGKISKLEKKQKLIRYLLSKGYESTIVFEKVNEFLE